MICPHGADVSEPPSIEQCPRRHCVCVEQMAAWVLGVSSAPKPDVLVWWERHSDHF